MKILAFLGIFVGLYQWYRAQEWQRAERLDKFVKQFQEDALLCLGTTAIDYSARNFTFRERDFLLRNDDALLALRHHSEVMSSHEAGKFPGEQANLRDAYDALLAFFIRLELAVTAGMIEKRAATYAFGYYLERFLTFDMHVDKNNVLDGKAPALMAWNYIKSYGNEDSMRRLKAHFGIKLSEPAPALPVK